jgi:hypothetical protein
MFGELSLLLDQLHTADGRAGLGSAWRRLMTDRLQASSWSGPGPPLQVMPERGSSKEDRPAGASGGTNEGAPKRCGGSRL